MNNRASVCVLILLTVACQSSPSTPAPDEIGVDAGDGLDASSPEVDGDTAPDAAGDEPKIVGTRWQELEGDLLPLPDCPQWSCFGATDPALVRRPDGQLSLYFTTGGADESDNTVRGPVLGRAVGGLGNWTLGDGPIHTTTVGQWDAHRETAFVRFDTQRDRWQMFYLGYAESFFRKTCANDQECTSGICEANLCVDPGIGQTWSTDEQGLTFEPSQQPIYRPTAGAWDGNFVTGASVVQGHDGTWRLYYVGAGTTVGVGLLESTDGEHWTPHPSNPVFEQNLSGWDQGILEPEVRLIGGIYHMWYVGYEEPLDLTSTSMAIGLATSTDGITWTRSGARPVLEPTGIEGRWNELRIVSPSVLVQEDGSMIMAVHGQSRADATNAFPLGRIGFYRSVP